MSTETRLQSNASSDYPLETTTIPERSAQRASAVPIVLSAVVRLEIAGDSGWSREQTAVTGP
jgi:hypothetical protein